MMKKNRCSHRNRTPPPTPDSFVPQHGDQEYNQTLKELYKTAHNRKTAVVNQANQVQENYDQFQLHQGTYNTPVDKNNNKMKKTKQSRTTLSETATLLCACVKNNKEKDSKNHDNMYASRCSSEVSSKTGGDASSITPILFETDDHEGLFDQCRLSSNRNLVSPTQNRISGSMKCWKERSQDRIFQRQNLAPTFDGKKKKIQGRRFKSQVRQRRLEDRAGAFPSLALIETEDW
eukprot:CAMPEP_0195284028 /NCGR_PEP_ID=MMETSP0707-20130614/2384_1 /TAXON_ID=33640 /ORGANISM="Asterionellopsis glacialis, Strain CCMP134" /LENGTH=232 /DNA_ID=CAMNT_0040343321 /DNA_START=69 /DNA_END=767 /DNA_ORIENTATION=+